MKYTGKRWTLAEIKAANEAAGNFFFSRDTMRFFGDTMRSFGVRHVMEDGEARVYVVRIAAPKRAPAGYQWRGEWRLFNQQTGEISKPTKTDRGD